MIVTPEAHPPLVDHATWERAQPDPPRRRARRSRYPLSGIATCATCGEPMVGMSTGQPPRKYRCRATWTSDWKGAQCPSPARIDAEALEAYVLDAVAAAEQRPGTSLPSASTLRKLPFKDQQRVLSQVVRRLVVHPPRDGRWSTDDIAARVDLELVADADQGRPATVVV